MITLHSPLGASLTKAISARRSKAALLPSLSTHCPDSAPDLFSNDYLSLTSDPILRALYLDKLSTSPLLFGSSGSRLGTGNTPVHVAFEARMQRFFGAQAALLFSTGYDANLSFWGAIPQAGDVIVFDELVHASMRDGMSSSRAHNAMYAFAHNSISSFRESLDRALKEHPQVSVGKATVFVGLEGLYSMDGDFAPLVEVMEIVDELVPRGCSHIAVDEAHSTAICGPGGRGLVAALGLSDRVDTVLHTFSKGYGSGGAILLTSQLIKDYISNYSRSFIYSTAMPCSSIVQLEAIFDFLDGRVGIERRDALKARCRQFEDMLTTSLQGMPPDILALRPRRSPSSLPQGIASPIFALLTVRPKALEQFLRERGYGTFGIPYPIVPRGEERIRLIVHSANTVADIEGLITLLQEWAAMIQGERVSATVGSRL